MDTAQIAGRSPDVGVPPGEPEDAQPDAHGIDVIFRGGESYEVSVRGHRLLVDQASGSGAVGAPPSPMELLIASVASCVASCAGQYLTQHGYGRDGLRVSADFDLAIDGPSRVSDIRLTVWVPHNMPVGRIPALYVAVSHSTVRNTLTTPPSVTIYLAADPVSSR
jgi:putative redox protein